MTHEEKRKVSDYEFVFMGIVTLITLIALSYTIGTHRWNLSQEYFPCQEDEVLGYSPSDINRVVCISVEAVK